MHSGKGHRQTIHWKQTKCLVLIGVSMCVRPHVCECARAYSCACLQCNLFLIMVGYVQCVSQTDRNVFVCVCVCHYICVCVIV